MIFGIKLVYFTRFLRVKNYPGAKSYPKLLQSSLKVTEALLTRISVVCAANPICCVIKSDGSNQWYWPDPQTVQLCGQRHNCQYHSRLTLDGGRWRLSDLQETFRKPSMEYWYTAVLWNIFHCISSTADTPHSQPSSVYNNCCPYHPHCIPLPLHTIVATKHLHNSPTPHNPHKRKPSSSSRLLSLPVVFVSIMDCST